MADASRDLRRKLRQGKPCARPDPKRVSKPYKPANPRHRMANFSQGERQRCKLQTALYYNRKRRRERQVPDAVTDRILLEDNCALLLEDGCFLLHEDDA